MKSSVRRPVVLLGSDGPSGTPTGAIESAMAAALGAELHPAGAASDDSAEPGLMADLGHAGVALRSLFGRQSAYSPQEVSLPPILANDNKR